MEWQILLSPFMSARQALSELWARQRRPTKTANWQLDNRKEKLIEKQGIGSARRRLSGDVGRCGGRVAESGNTTLHSPSPHSTSPPLQLNLHRRRSGNGPSGGDGVRAPLVVSGVSGPTLPRCVESPGRLTRFGPRRGDPDSGTGAAAVMGGNSSHLIPWAVADYAHRGGSGVPRVVKRLNSTPEHDRP